MNSVTSGQRQRREQQAPTPIRVARGNDERVLPAEPTREYTTRETVTANLPYAAMILLGAATIGLGVHPTPWAVGGALGYAIYGLIGAMWIMAFVCPFCAYFGTRGCPCGYGAIAARLTGKGEQECFPRKFRRHIPVIVPLWLIPPAVGIIALVQAWDWRLTGLVGAFVLNSYVVLPWLARGHSCGDCPQRESCPWMSSTGSRLSAL